MYKKNTVPIIAEYLQVFVELLESQGIDRKTLLEGLEIKPTWFDDANAMMPYATFLEIIRRAIRLTDNPMLSAQFGTMLTLRTHGFLGYAVLSSETYGEAVDVAVKYYRTRSVIFSLKMFKQKDRTILQFDELLPHTDLLPFVSFVTLSSFYTMAIQLIGDKLHEDLVVKMNFEKPDFFEHPEELPVKILFNSANLQVSFPTALLETKLHFSDPRLAEMATEQCEKQLENMPRRSSLLAQVKNIILANLSERITQEEVASELCMGTRTLKRRLSALGITYQELLDDIKKNLAIEYLIQTKKTVEDIGWSLGYSDPSNFGRAFRRWTGLSPSHYREEYKDKATSEL